jgi:hypothetical protein
VLLLNLIDFFRSLGNHANAALAGPQKSAFKVALATFLQKYLTFQKASSFFEKVMFAIFNVYD